MVLLLLLPYVFSCFLFLCRDRFDSEINHRSYFCTACLIGIFRPCVYTPSFDADTSGGYAFTYQIVADGARTAQ